MKVVFPTEYGPISSTNGFAFRPSSVIGCIALRVEGLGFRVSG